ncbi:hypothetical protein DFH06DRAFT_1462573 [Mycena polygramma]|nr:hypothetical protein DFH06DRAFT_1462573 [Mycena polygramma]
MDLPNDNPQNGDSFLRHEADMWELDCLAEQELRAQQIREDFGLEDDIGKLVDHCTPNYGWFNLDSRVDFIPEKLLHASRCSTPDHGCSMPSCSPESLGNDSPQAKECPILGRDVSGSNNPQIGALDCCRESSQSCQSFDEDQPPPRRKSARTARTVYSSDYSEYSPSSRESTPDRYTSGHTSSKKRKLHNLRRPTVQKAKCDSYYPPRASVGAGRFRCGLDGCPKICGSRADLRRHRESLAHCAKKYACPGCPMRFTRQDALKRHLNNHSRCKDPSMTALRDQFLATAAAVDAEEQGLLDRVVRSLYKKFLAEG